MRWCARLGAGCVGMASSSSAATSPNSKAEQVMMGSNGRPILEIGGLTSAAAKCTRMTRRRRQHVVLGEARRHPPPKTMRMPDHDHAPLPVPASLNDVDREMEVLLYGFRGGFAEKIHLQRIYNKYAKCTTGARTQEED